MVKLKDLEDKNEFAISQSEFDFGNNYLVQLMRTTNFMKHENQCHQFKV